MSVTRPDTDEFKTYTRAALKQIAVEILSGMVHQLAAAAGPRLRLGHKRTRRLWRRRGRR